MLYRGDAEPWKQMRRREKTLHSSKRGGTSPSGTRLWNDARDLRHGDRRETQSLVKGVRGKLVDTGGWSWSQSQSEPRTRLRFHHQLHRGVMLLST